MPEIEAEIGAPVIILGTFRDNDGAILTDVTGVKVTIEDPMGALLLFQDTDVDETSSGNGIWRYVYTVPKNYPPGLYYVLFEGTSVSDGDLALRADFSAVHVTNDILATVTDGPTLVRSGDTEYDATQRGEELRRNRPIEVGSFHRNRPRKTSTRRSDYPGRFDT